MTHSNTDLSTAEWKDRLAPTLATSLRETSEAMTKPPPVQSWLHEASFEAAQDVAQTSGSMAQGMGYMYMVDTLPARFPNLMKAVRDLTEGCGRVDLHWRPLSPSFSRLYIDFGWEASIDVFVRLDAHSLSAIRDALETIAEALPSGTPYPNRPNEGTGLIAYDGACVAARVREHLGEDDGTYRSVVLLSKEGASSDPMSAADAVRQLAERLR